MGKGEYGVGRSRAKARELNRNMLTEENGECLAHGTKQNVRSEVLKCCDMGRAGEWVQLTEPLHAWHKLAT